MIKKLSFVFMFACLGLAACVTAAFAVDVRPYFGLKGAVSIVSSDFDLGYYYDPYYYNYYYERYYDDSSDVVFAGSAALGMKVNDFRFEFEYTHRTEARQSYDWFPNIDQRFDSFMLNAFYGYPATPKIIPYIGMGLGMTHVRNKLDYLAYSESVVRDCFSIGFDLGVSFAVAEHLNLDCGFKALYLGTMEVEYEDLMMYALDFYFGLRYTI